MQAKYLLMFISLLTFSSCGSSSLLSSSASLNSISDSASLEDSSMKHSSSKESSASHYILKVNGKEFAFSLNQNQTSEAFKSLLPLTLNMSELNGNEKYCYLDSSIRHDEPSHPNEIYEGDLMLFGDNCVVLFYKSFNTSYSYVRLGALTDSSLFSDAVGDSDITAEFKAI